jgi:hypothetical protein
MKLNNKNIFIKNMYSENWIELSKRTKAFIWLLDSIYTIEDIQFKETELWYSVFIIYTSKKD